MKHSQCSLGGLLMLAPFVVFAAADIKVTSGPVMIIGSCNVTMTVNTGNPNVRCNDVESEDFRKKFMDWFPNTEYAQSMRAAAIERSQIETLTNQIRNLDAGDAGLDERVSKLSDQIRSLVTEQGHDRANSRKVVQDLLESAQRQFNDVVVMQDDAIEVLTLQAQRNQSRITAANLELLSFNARLDRIETDLRSFMDSFYAGDIDRVVMFLGASVGAAYGGTEIEPRYAATAELITPRFRNLAMLIEFGRIDWREERSYNTLDGMDPESFTVDRTQEYSALGLAWRTPIQWRELTVKSGVLAGYSTGAQAGSGKYAASFLYAEWIRRSLLVSMGLRADYLETVPDEHRRFNLLGNAWIHREVSDTIVWSLELRLIARI